MWHWEPVDAGRSGSSGDISKLFKNETYKQPGALAVNAPSADATLLAREAIQNSWDAARQLRERLEARGGRPEPFRLRFRYCDLAGSEKQAAVDALSLRPLRDRAASTDRTKLGLRERDCLAALDDDEPLSLLLLEESATTGMEGPWGPTSKMYLALVSIGFTQKQEGAGGSYGYGKAGLIRASAIRTVLAYSAFERDAVDSATRRLLGMTYWGQHELNGVSFTGFARLGKEVDKVVEPFTDEDADARAAAIGMRTRDASVISDLGTTFLLVDPTVEADDLRRGIERNWWPALEDGLFEVEIECSDGTILHPRPKKDEVMRPFIRGYEVATTPQDNDVDDEYRKQLAPYRPSGSRQYLLGTVGLVADLKGWSYAHNGDVDDENSTDHQSLVALVRGPRMVVEYYPCGRNQPFVRGAFVADPDVDDLLRQTEPKAHDAWQSKLEEEGIDAAAPKVAAELLKRLKREVREFRTRLKPPPPREQDIRLPLLDELFRGILENRGTKNPPPPPADPRLVSIRIDQRVEQVDDESIRLAADVTLHLTERYDAGEEAPSRLVFRYAFDEDGRLGDDCPISVQTPEGFLVEDVVARRGTIVTGTLTRRATSIHVTSDPYPADWTGQLIVTADPIALVGASATSSWGASGDE